MNLKDIPYEEIQALVSHCNDPQIPFHIREAAEVVQQWLNDEESEE